MTVMPQQGAGVARAPRHEGGLYDVLELILDKGLVIDAYIRVSLVGIELLTIDIRVVVASVDTYLRFAEAVNRLDLTESKESKTLPEFVGDLQERGAAGKAKGALTETGEAAKGALGGAAETFSEAFRRGLGSDEREKEDAEPERVPRQSRHSQRSRPSGERSEEEGDD